MAHYCKSALVKRHILERLDFIGVGAWILSLPMVKPGGNTGESWVLPLTTNCKTKTRKFNVLVPSTSDIWTDIKWSGEKLRRRTMKWFLWKGGLTRKKLMFLLFNHLPSRYVEHRSLHEYSEFNPPSTIPQLALLTIGKCGFGFSFDWAQPPRSADGKMTIQHALHCISDSTTAVLVVPKWLQRLSISGWVLE